MRCSFLVCTVIASALMIAAVAVPRLNASGQGSPGATLAPELDPSLEVLRAYVGYAWEIDTKWESGQSLKARNEYRLGLNGKFVTADTFVDDGKGGEYQRYHSIFAKYPDRPGVMRIHGFNHDGSTDVFEMEVIPSGEGGHPTLRVRGERKGQDGKPMNLVQEIRLISDHEFTWKVIQLSDAGDQVLMNGSYKRTKALD